MPNSFTADPTKTPEERLIAIAELGWVAPEALNLREIRLLCKAHLSQTSTSPGVVNQMIFDSKISH